MNGEPGQPDQPHDGRVQPREMRPARRDDRPDDQRERDGDQRERRRIQNAIRDLQRQPQADGCRGACRREPPPALDVTGGVNCRRRPEIQHCGILTLATEPRKAPLLLQPHERTSPTQPFPTRPAPFNRQGLAIDGLIDFTPALPSGRWKS